MLFILSTGLFAYVWYVKLLSLLSAIYLLNGAIYKNLLIIIVISVYIMKVES